jgi:hypothetical protein
MEVPFGVLTSRNHSGKAMGEQRLVDDTFDR